ncbi:DUF6207 family protein [Streptomyces roseolus]|uniref:DUF6207 family protein n=2 Tax=Streptomyces roseolus TaxID=67358 RepID=UPI00365209EF
MSPCPRSPSPGRTAETKPLTVVPVPVTRPHPHNSPPSRSVLADMEAIDLLHLAEPGLVVVDVTAVDETTVRAVAEQLDRYRPPLAPRRHPVSRANQA